MMNLRYLLVLILGILSACSSTTLTIKSNPPGARAVFTQTGISAVTDQKLKVPTGVFGEQNKQREDVVVLDKQGYRTKRQLFTLHKNKDNIFISTLGKLDTSINIKSTPAPVHLEMISKGRGHKKIIEFPVNNQEYQRLKRDSSYYILPEGWPKKFTTPIHLQCTQEEAKEFMDNVRLKMQPDSGYVPVGDYRKLTSTGIDLNIKPDYANDINIAVKPVVTTIQVVSTPPGAIVEDISSGGFGYLGETPLIRNFNWEDVVQWSEKRNFLLTEEASKERKKSGINLIYLDLRITRPGYEDAFLRRLRIPIGEERSFHKNLKARISTINFASDPAGAHIYVERENVREVYDPATRSFSETAVIHKKHLGTTPFTLNMDPNDPLRHGEKLLFEKTGYVSSSMRFSEGNDSYYEVMMPIDVKKR